MKSLQKDSSYPIIVDIFIDEIFRYTYKGKSDNTLKDLKLSILNQAGLYSINYILEYNHRDYTSFDTFHLKEIFMFHKQVQINIKTIETFKKGKKIKKYI